MSCHPHNTTEALSPYTREYESTTPVITAQRNFAQRLRGVLGRINARIREAIIENDLFQLQGEDTEALVDDLPEDVFDFPTDDSRIRGFLRWLRDQLDNQFLEVVGPDRNQFILSAYATGIRNVHQQLSDADIAFQRPDVDDLLGRPFHTSSLQELYTRTYENLVSVRTDTAQAVREELINGFREGQNPTRIAQNLTDRVDSIGKHRSTMIARSECINAHTQGSLSRIDELNQSADAEIAAGHGEFDAAMGSPRTCAFCRRLNGTPLTTNEMAGGVVEFRGDVYRLGPPSHVNGRCNVKTIVGAGPIDTPLDERLPEGITVVS